MTRKRLVSSLLCAAMAAQAAFAQRKAPMTPGAPAPPAVAAPQPASAVQVAAGNFYAWQVRPNDVDGYFSSNIPQPVCRAEGGVFKIFILSNFDHYPSKNFNNNSNAVRVGVITTPADAYQLRSNPSDPNDPHSLPGARQEFAATSILRPGDAEHTIYIFGGKTSSDELDDVYSYNSTGFHFVGTIPQGKRAGAVALPSQGKIYLFGGRSGGTVLNQVLEFDPQNNSFTPVTAMPQGFYGARGMTKAAAGNNYIYLVGGRTQSGGGPTDRIYRFNVATKQTIEVKDLSNNPLVIPAGSGYPMATWDPSGNVRIIAAGGSGASGPWTWGNIQAWILNDNYPPSPNDGKASLTPAPYNDSTRARDMAGAVKCGDATYLIGGTYGHGTSFQDRGKLVDKLGAAGIKRVDRKAIDINTLRTQ